MHEGYSQCWALMGDETQGLGQIIFAHGGLEVGEG